MIRYFIQLTIRQRRPWTTLRIERYFGLNKKHHRKSRKKLLSKRKWRKLKPPRPNLLLLVPSCETSCQKMRKLKNRIIESLHCNRLIYKLLIKLILNHTLQYKSNLNHFLLILLYDRCFILTSLQMVIIHVC